MDIRSDPTTSNRRQLLQLCGIATLGGVAGCLGTDTDDETGASTDDTASTESDAGESGTVTRVAEDGWGEPHEDVEIPDEPGTAILQIGGETVTLQGLIATVEENPDGMGQTGAEQFEARVPFRDGQYRDYGLQVSFTRVLGYEDTSGRWVESDAVTFTRDDNTELGNVIYRLYDDGHLADSDDAGELAGRRFVDESFIRVSREGVVTIVETIDSHVDESLNGQFELGARLPSGWDQT